MWIGFCIVTNFNVSPGQMNVMAVVAAEGGVVNIEALGVSWECILTSCVFLICSEHLDKMLLAFLVYRAVMQDGGFASGWKGVMTLQIVHWLSDKYWIVEVTFPLPLFHLEWCQGIESWCHIMLWSFHAGCPRWKPCILRVAVIYSE